MVFALANAVAASVKRQDPKPVHALMSGVFKKLAVEIFWIQICDSEKLSRTLEGIND